MAANEILNELLSYLKMNAKALSERCGYERPQAFYDIQKGKTKKISPVMTDKIISVFPQINSVWLLTGEGSMLNEVGDVVSEDKGHESMPSLSKVPLLPLNAIGGSLNDFVSSVHQHDCEQVVCPIEGADFAITVSGDSMSPEYPNGSQIFIKKINEKAFIDWGRVYVLDTCNGIVIKRLVPSAKEGHVRCLSINEDPIYAPFDVSWTDIFGVYRVLLCMSRK